jgi:hypothetical protein
MKKKSNLIIIKVYGEYLDTYLDLMIQLKLWIDSILGEIQISYISRIKMEILSQIFQNIIDDSKFINIKKI